MLIFTVYFPLVEAALDNFACFDHASLSERLSLDAPNPVPPNNTSPRKGPKATRTACRTAVRSALRNVCVNVRVACVCGECVCVELSWGLLRISLICSCVDPVLSIAGAIVSSKKRSYGARRLLESRSMSKSRYLPTRQRVCALLRERRLEVVDLGPRGPQKIPRRPELGELTAHVCHRGLVARVLRQVTFGLVPGNLELAVKPADLALHIRHLLGPRRRSRARGGASLRLEHLDPLPGAREGSISGLGLTARRRGAPFGRSDVGLGLIGGHGRTARRARQLRLEDGDLPLPRLDLPPLCGVAQPQLVELGLKRLPPFGLDFELDL